jgi:probable addiction module antidote protein
MLRASSYRESLLESLKDPIEAVAYLNAGLEDSIEAFLKALKNVVQAHQVKRVAEVAGVQRESLYRSLSEQGNPTIDTLNAVLTAVGLRIAIEQNVKREHEELVPLPPRIQTQEIEPIYPTEIKFARQHLVPFHMYTLDVEQIIRNRVRVQKESDSFGPLGVAIPPTRPNRQPLIWSSK